jgi:hypothetical protein
LPILIHRYGIDGVEIDVIVLILDLGLSTIVGSAVRV